MAIEGFQHEKCLQRNRIAARRGNLSAAPIRFLRDEDFGQEDFGQNADGGGSGAGRIAPLCSVAQALAKINAARPGEEPLTDDDVYVHYIEACNSNFIGDRYMFLGTSTLKNVVRDAGAGFAFMNSHRTGGMSHPAELPFGKTFIGRYEKGDPNAPGTERALVGFYMLRGLHPNGAGGPSTDDLHRMIDGGTLFDVSVGLYGGTDVCDVCGTEVDAYDPDEGWLCKHSPGTTYRMTDEEIEAQKERGVPDGRATSTLTDAGCGEVSGVFDGAVPSAGFRKTLSLAKSGHLDKTASAQARQAYSKLLSKGESELMDGQGIIAAINEGFAGLGTRLGIRNEAPPPPAANATPPTNATPPATTPAPATTLSPEVAARLNEQQEQLAVANAQIEQLRRDGEEREALAAKREAATQLATSEAWVDAQVKAFKITPAAAEKFKALAAGHPDAFALAQAGIEANPVITALAGDTSAEGSSKTVGGAVLAGDGDAVSLSGQLEALTKQHMKDNPGASYADAFSHISANNKELAAAYREAASGGNN